MSVINKMLRDLDSRQAAGGIPFQMPAATASGAVFQKDSDRAGFLSGSLRFALVMAALVLGGGAGAWWYLNQSKAPLLKVEPIRALSTPAVNVLVAVEPASVLPAPAPVVAIFPVPESGTVGMDRSLKMDATFKWFKSHGKAAKPEVVAGTQRGESISAMSARTSPSSAIASPAPVTAPHNLLRRSPALDSLAQAQSLWTAGSRDAAINLLRETLAATERAHLADTTSANNSVLASLARELARMQLAEGQVSQALAMLTRLEQALSGFADVWALRGNAAQRLGRHEESTLAYLTALKLRPDEARWMLGAAVSLAAQGKTSNAAELAEKARASGVLSPEVATYLRQLGVTLQER